MSASTVPIESASVFAAEPDSVPALERSPSGYRIGGRPVRMVALVSTVLVHHGGRHRRDRVTGGPTAGTVAFRIDRSGRLLDATVAHSTGLPVLDLAALSIVRRASPIPAIPDALPDEVAITLPTARLAEGASSAISPPRASSSTDRDHLLQSRTPPSTAPGAVRGCRIRLPSVAA